MFAYVEANNYGHYLLKAESGAEKYYQVDYDFPGLAGLFGWVPCGECNLTDGTVNCEHKRAGDMIGEAAAFLDDEPSGEVDSCLFD